MSIKSRSIWDGFLEPINPYLAVIAGLLNIAFGAWQLSPGATDPVTKYPFSDQIYHDAVWGVPVLLVGIGLVAAFRWYNIRFVSIGLSVNGVLWAIMSGLVFYEDWHSNLFILMGVISLYSLFISANLKVNSKADRNDRFVLKQQNMI